MSPKKRNREFSAKTIWYYPLDRLVNTLEHKQNKGVYILFMSLGILMFLEAAATGSWGKDLHLWQLITGIVVLGALAGIIVFSLTSFIIFFIGRILNGKAEFWQIRQALAWGLSPILLLILLWIVKIFVFGNDLFLTNTNFLEENYNMAFLLMFSRVIQIVLGIYSLGLLVLLLGEVQQFSLRRSFFNLMFTMLSLSFLSLIISNLIRFIYPDL